MQKRVDSLDAMRSADGGVTGTVQRFRGVEVADVIQVGVRLRYP